MNKEEFKKLAEEEFINNTMKHLDSALIFTYIQNLEKKSELGEHYKHLYSELKKQKDEIFKYIKSFEYYIPEDDKNELLRMLGEIDENN